MLFSQQRAWSLMSQESNPNEAATPAATKLLNERPSDFSFPAASLVYSEAWDTASSEEPKLKLNEILSALSNGKIDFETFYREINQYRAGFRPEQFSGGMRTYIETQRKKDWRRREEREGRNKRHGR